METALDLFFETDPEQQKFFLEAMNTGHMSIRELTQKILPSIVSRESFSDEDCQKLYGELPWKAYITLD